MDIRINGSGGANVEIKTVTLAAGLATFGTKLSKFVVLGITPIVGLSGTPTTADTFGIAQAVPNADGYIVPSAGGVVHVASSNNASTATLQVALAGY